jgi:hypothetical protein
MRPVVRTALLFLAAAVLSMVSFWIVLMQLRIGLTVLAVALFAWALTANARQLSAQNVPIGFQGGQQLPTARLNSAAGITLLLVCLAAAGAGRAMWMA